MLFLLTTFLIGLEIPKIQSQCKLLYVAKRRAPCFLKLSTARLQHMPSLWAPHLVEDGRLHFKIYSKRAQNNKSTLKSGNQEETDKSHLN